jgi:enoyl-[acyl-carrier protein] reductase III
LRPYHLHRTYTVVVESLVDSVQRALPLMTGSRPKSVITISSVGSQYTLPRYASIGSAKAALEAMTRYLANELGPLGITCNAVSPGVVDTDSASYYASASYDAFLSRVVASTPLGRLAQPSDVAKAVLMLASPYARMITGQVLAVDGGSSLRAPGFEGL